MLTVEMGINLYTVDDIGNGQASAGFQEAKRLAVHSLFVGRQVDDAVGNNYVSKSIRKIDPHLVGQNKLSCRGQVHFGPTHPAEIDFAFDSHRSNLFIRTTLLTTLTVGIGWALSLKRSTRRYASNST